LEVVYSKIRGINLYWLITGKGDIAIDKSHVELIRARNNDSYVESISNRLVRKQHEMGKHRLEEIMDLT
jgi:hypothetical protein